MDLNLRIINSDPNEKFNSEPNEKSEVKTDIEIKNNENVNENENENENEVRYLSTCPEKNHQNFEKVRDELSQQLTQLKIKFSDKEKNIRIIDNMISILDKMVAAWATKKKRKWIKQYEFVENIGKWNKYANFYCRNPEWKIPFLNKKPKKPKQTNTIKSWTGLQQKLNLCTINDLCTFEKLKEDEEKKKIVSDLSTVQIHSSESEVSEQSEIREFKVQISNIIDNQEPINKKVNIQLLGITINPTVSIMSESEQDPEPGPKTIQKMYSLCTHGSHIKKPCLVVSHETLIRLLQTSFFTENKTIDASLFEINLPKIVDYLYNPLTQKRIDYNPKKLMRCYMKNISYLCQQTKCPIKNDDTKKCMVPILLKRIITHIPKIIKKQMDLYNCILLFGNLLMASKYPTCIGSCHSKECKQFGKSIIHIPWIDVNTMPQTMCNTCDTEHYYHGHKFTCTGCKATMCTVCKKVPYHELQACVPLRLELGIEDENIKICPNKFCMRLVEKIEGCDHIRCMCGFHFCFRCLAKLNPEDPYNHTCLSESVLAGPIDGAFRGEDLNHEIEAIELAYQR